jgi:pimeloyl-ACP methyl ester carboxylesterase
MSVASAHSIVNVNGAPIAYETAGEGIPLVMIHAGVADSRQWNNEFEAWEPVYRVVRYDLRGYGRSEPVDGDFTHLADLEALLDHLAIREPVILIGCSMGGELALNFALAHPEQALAVILVGSAPSGLALDVPTPAKFAEAEAAYEAQDWDRLAELETQIFFDGMGRTAEQVDPAMRRLAKEMVRQALDQELLQLGRKLPDLTDPAAARLDELTMPILVIAGKHDVPYILAAVDYLAENLPDSQTVILPDAAHLPNMDHPDLFRETVDAFLQAKLPGAR